jgi:hypothetical protein
VGPDAQLGGVGNNRQQKRQRTNDTPWPTSEKPTTSGQSGQLGPFGQLKPSGQLEPSEHEFFIPNSSICTAMDHRTVAVNSTSNDYPFTMAIHSPSTDSFHWADSTLAVHLCAMHVQQFATF